MLFVFQLDVQRTPEPDTKPDTKPAKGSSKIANLLGMIKPGDLSRSNLKKVGGGNGAAESTPPSLPSTNDQSDDLMSQNDAFKPTQMVTPMHVDGEKKVRSSHLLLSLNSEFENLFIGT